MRIRLSTILILLGVALASASANAAYVELVPDPQDNDGSIDLPPSGFTATYSPTGVVDSVWFAPDVSPQSPSNVADSIMDQFSVMLTLVGQNDNFSSGNVSLPGNPFNVLAVHLGGQGGGNELLFFYNTSITSFTVNTFSQGGSNNLSNFRAYSVVPIPAAVWLFASGLIGLAGVARRKP